MPFEHDTDPARLYDELRRSFVDLVTHLSVEQLGTQVPATPAWDVAAVFAHVVGITADLNHARFGAGMGPDAWTASQVESRRGRPVVETAAEWEAEAPRFVDGLQLFGYSFGAHYLADLLHHACDVRHALRMSAPQDDLTLAVALDFYLETFDKALRTAAVGSMLICIGDETIMTGSGIPVAELRAPRFEVFRALGGRRSESQLRALDWRGEFDNVLPILSPYPLPERDIADQIPS